MLFYIILSISPFLITRSTSAPAPAAQVDQCNGLEYYTDLTESTPFLGSWSMTGAAAVVSNSEPSNLEATYSETVGVTITVGISLGADLPEEVAEVGFDASVSWSRFDTDGWTAGVECPPGTPDAYTCGMSAIPHYVTIAGTAAKYYASGDCGNQNGNTVPGSEVPFSMQTPVTDAGTVAPDGGNHNLFTFAACICSTSKNQTTGPGLGHCPAPSC